MTSKKKTPAPVAVETSALASPVSGFAPYVRPSGSGFAPRTPGYLGYGKGTGTEALALAFSKPEGATKAEALAVYLEATKTKAPTEKAAKASISVFLSDSVRPFGRYYASRSLALEVSGDTFRFSPESVEKADSAVKAGALEALRAIPEKDRTEGNKAYRAFLVRFGFLTEE